MSFPASFIDDLKTRVPLSRLASGVVTFDKHKSQPAKGDFWGSCPFHAEKTASFHIDDGKGLYHCFGCKAGGDHFKFLEDARGLSFLEAAEELARIAGVPMPAADPAEKQNNDRRLVARQALDAAQDYFQRCLWTGADGGAGLTYLEKRQIPFALARAFGLGCAPAGGGLLKHLAGLSISRDAALDAGLAGRDDKTGFVYERFRGRLTFPVADRLGRIIGFAGRDITAKHSAKYLNSPETLLFDKGALLWNAHRAREAAAEGAPVVLAEGYLDVIALEQAGFAAVAPMGTAMTEAQLMGLWRLSDAPTICFDNDAAGHNAAARLATLALPHAEPGRSLRFATLTLKKDPDEYFHSYGAEALSQCLEGAAALADTVWGALVASADTTTPEGRAKLAAAVAEAVSVIHDDAARDAYQGEFKARLRDFWKEKGVTATVVRFPKRAKEPPGGGGDGGGPDPQRILAHMNRDYALVMLGQKALVISDSELDSAHAMDRFRVWSVGGFLTWMQPRRLWAGGKSQSYGEWWLGHGERRQYRGIEFRPQTVGEADQAASYYNLWRGFAVAPHADAALAAPWFDHVSEVVCSGNAELAQWVTSWFASLVQFPRERFGTSLVMRGREGSGKTLVGEIVGSLFPANYFLVDDPRFITGQFNSHQASCLLLQVDEGFWAGDKASEGRLKGLITSHHQMIEFKGVDQVRLPNYVRLLISSNEDWVVPVGLSGRRYCVVDVSPHKVRDPDYFAGLAALYRRPEAQAALLAALLDWKIDRRALRRPPATDALFAQKLRTFDPVQAFFYETLQRGRIGDSSAWPDRVRCADLHRHYLKRCERYGARHPLGPDSFGKMVGQLLKGAVKKRQRQGDVREYVYDLPGLDVARLDFEEIAGQKIDWGDDVEELEDLGPAGPGGRREREDEEAL